MNRPSRTVFPLMTAAMALALSSGCFGGKVSTVKLSSSPTYKSSQLKRKLKDVKVSVGEFTSAQGPQLTLKAGRPAARR